MRRPRFSFALSAMALAAPLLLACSGGSSLPEAPPCTTPTPTPIPTRGQREPDFRYLNALDEGVERLEALTAQWRATWPDRRFSSRDEFRPGFVVYAGESQCLVDALEAFEPANTAKYGEFDAQFEGALAQYREALRFGLEAVRKRNVSEYREFHALIDAAQARLEETLDSAPRP